MDVTLATTLVLVLAAMFAGTVDAIAGGGGLVTVPALRLAGLPVELVLGTNKAQSAWGTLAAAIAFLRARRVDRVQALYAFPLGLCGALVGASVVLAIPRDVLDTIVIAMLVGAAIVLVVKKPSERGTPRARPLAIAALALVVGAYDGFFGPGTGTFLVVGFVAIGGKSLVDASADAKIVNLASNVGALIVFARAGTIRWDIAVPMAVGQLFGGVLGARLALRGGARLVRICVLAVSAALIGKLAYDAIG
jgi:uncharacterized membrane protein YfcA